MPNGVSAVKAEISVRDRFGATKPLRVVHSIAQTEWVGPFTTQVATGTTEQALIAVGTQGLTTITALLITSNQNVSVTYGTAASNAPVTLDMNGVHCMSGTSLTEITISNNSGNTALITYFIAGS